MKKFLKFLLGAAAVAGTVCGIVYFIKNILGVGKDEDYDDEADEFDELDDEAEDREYVTLDLDDETADDTDEAETDDEAEADDEIDNVAEEKKEEAED